MSRLLKILFLVIGFYLSTGLFNLAQATDYVCPPEEVDKINQQGINWLPYPPPFVPGDYSKFYIPFIKNNYHEKTHQDTTKLPNSESVGCLIIYAQKYFNSLYGSHFVPDDIDRVIIFALNNNFNPSLFLAIWLEESHAGDRSPIEFGCGGTAGGIAGFDAQLNCLQNLHPLLKNTSLFHCFLCGYAGDCTANLSCGWTNTDQFLQDKWTAFVQYYNYLTQPGPTQTPTGSSSSISTSSNANLLRPFPKQLVPEEKNRSINDPYQTFYCAMRPTAAQINRFDRRDEFIDIKTQGTLTQDFTEFITPLLSITDPDKPDYLLPYVDKAQRYLADYLEGRAYYEGVTEPINPNPTQQADLFTRLGVFRKLAPKTYQDKLKRAVILRAAGQFGSMENPYGFDPATKEIHNYLVAEWSGSKVYLKDFINNWAPLPEEFGQDQAAYAAAYEAWKNLDAGKWYQLWPYVPMFTREDSKGYIEIIDSNPPPDPWSPPGSTPIEINASNKKTVEVIHPHLSRTYEVSTSLSYLLTPESVHDVPTPATNNDWTPARWGDSIWWLDPSLLQPPPTPGLEYGPHCDVDNTIYSSGDLAYENIITTSVNRQDIHVQNPEYQGPPSQQTVCGLLFPCERCIVVTPILHYVDPSGCFFSQTARSNPDYFITHTPFLDKILTSTSTLSQRGIFAILKPYQAGLKPDEQAAWPGLGNIGEESPKYSFSAGGAEAGDQKPGNTQSFFYRYLGSIQCAKERTLQVLLPFITGQPYTPYAYKCFPELTPPATGDPGGGTGTGTGTGTGSVSCSQAVADRAKAIVDNLQRGFWGYFNKSPDYPELFDDALFAQNPDLIGINTNVTFVNMFWCTWLVVKSFSESSSPILVPQLVTHNLTGYFQGEGRYIDANNITIQDVCPGMAIFFHIPAGSSSNAHVGIVYSVSSDGVTTVESNAPYKTMFYPVDESGHFQIVGSDDDTIEVSGFGMP